MGQHYLIINGSAFSLTNQIVNRNLDQIVIGSVCPRMFALFGLFSFDLLIRFYDFPNNN